MKKWKEKTGEFVALNQSGEEIVIEVYTLFSETRDNTGTHPLAGPKELKTANGEFVNRLEKGRYATVDAPDDELTSDDPDAP